LQRDEELVCRSRNALPTRAADEIEPDPLDVERPSDELARFEVEKLARRERLLCER
jgi:hypothetical protein